MQLSMFKHYYEIPLKAASYEEDTEWFYFEAQFYIKRAKKVIPLLSVDFAEKRGLCADCDMDTHGHPMNSVGEKYCTILFHDAIKPKWKLEDVV